jgi:hypothetical protein
VLGAAHSLPSNASHAPYAFLVLFLISAQINLFLYCTKLNGYPSNAKMKDFIIVLDKPAQVFLFQLQFQGPQTPALENHVCVINHWFWLHCL